jgi:hypothetical protein
VLGIVGPALAALLSLSTAPAWASGESAAAEALFQQAKTLADEKRWADACPKFEAAYRLDKTLGALMNLADCEEHLGRVASAWAHWGEAVELAEKNGDKRAGFAGKRRDALVKRLPMILLVVAARKSALDVFRDDVRIDPAAYGVPLPSDPGPHVVSVRRGGEVLHRQPVTAAEGQTAPVTLDLAAIERAAPPPPVAVTVVAPLGNQKVIGYAILGVGAATLVAAAGLEIAALVNRASANAEDACFNGFCTTEGFDAVGRARTFATAGQWVGIGGIVVAAVGMTLALTAPRLVPAPKASLSVSGWAAAGGGGVALGGVIP